VLPRTLVTLVLLSLVLLTPQAAPAHTFGPELRLGAFRTGGGRGDEFLLHVAPRPYGYLAFYSRSGQIRTVRIDTAGHTILDSARDWTAKDAYRAIHQLAELKRDARRLLAGTDVFVVPTTPTIYRVAEVEADPIRLNARLGTYTNFVNLMDLCGIAVPSGFRASGARHRRPVPCRGVVWPSGPS